MGNKEIFDQTASHYDTPERIRISAIIVDAIKKHLSDCRQKTAIDFGCGTGLIGMELLDEFEQILFVDVSQNMIQYVEDKITTKNLKNANALCFDLENESHTIEPVDCIIAAQVLLHIQDTDDIIKKLASLLRSDGHLIIVDFNKNDLIKSDLVHNGFDSDELTAVMNRAGFSITFYETFYHGEKIFMNQDASMFILDAKKEAVPVSL